jgi:hypothetical protein
VNNYVFTKRRRLCQNLRAERKRSSWGITGARRCAPVIAYSLRRIHPLAGKKLGFRLKARLRVRLASSVVVTDRRRRQCRGLASTFFHDWAPNLVDYSEDSRRPVRAEAAGKRCVEKMASPCCPDGNTEEADRPARELRERYPNYAGG